MNSQEDTSWGTRRSSSGISRPAPPCGLAEKNPGCPRWSEAWRPSGTRMMVCSGSSTSRTEVASSSSSSSTPSSCSCRPQSLTRITTEVDASLADPAGSSRLSGSWGSWRRRRLAGLGPCGCGVQQGEGSVSELLGCMFCMSTALWGCRDTGCSEDSGAGAGGATAVTGPGVLSFILVTPETPRTSIKSPVLDRKVKSWKVTLGSASRASNSEAPPRCGLGFPVA